jgi:hypothetical protein
MARPSRLRLTPRRVDALTAVGLALLAAGVSLSSPYWARFLRQPLAAVGEEPAATSVPAGPEPSPEAERKINVKLFFETEDQTGLLSEDRSVPFTGDLPRQVRIVLEELIRGSETGLVRPVDPATRVLEVFVSAGGVAYLDLSGEAAAGLKGGSRAELLSVYALVNSVTANFPSIKRVQILLDDRPVPTLAGHVDLSRPLAPDMTFLAPVPVFSPTPVS